MTQAQQTQDSTSQEVQQPYQANRATIVYDNMDDGIDDDDDSTTEDVLTGIDVDLGDEDLDLVAEDLLTEEEGDEFVEGSPRFEAFKTDFGKAFGIELSEAVELVQSLHQDKVAREVNQQKYELSDTWQVPITEVEKRLTVVAKLWQKLPEDRRASMDNTKGAAALWSRYEATQAKRNPTVKTTNATASRTARTQYDFTQKQIDSMDAATYAANSSKIMVAYANKRVKI